MTFLGREEDNLEPRNIHTTPPMQPWMEGKKPESWVSLIPSVEDCISAKETTSQISLTEA